MRSFCRLFLVAAMAAAVVGGPGFRWGARAAGARSIEIWHGDVQRIGHLGDAQDDFNLMGRVEPWREVDQLSYQVNGAAGTPLAFRAYRRLIVDGDFNADIPIARLKPGDNEIRVTAVFRDGETAVKTVRLHRGSGAAPLPVRIRWKDLKHFQDAGQAVDGRWELTPQGLRTRQIGYDRVFLIGERSWQDYEVRTAVTIHRVASETSALSGGNGVGVILRFAGHVAGGPLQFASGQPKWGYQPFGAIGWVRWRKAGEGPHAQFYPGDNNKWENFAPFPVVEGRTYSMRFACDTLPDSGEGSGVTRYSFKVWQGVGSEPAEWTWQRTQTSRHALRRGGAALLAHHVDATFGDVEITGR